MIILIKYIYAQWAPLDRISSDAFLNQKSLLHKYIVFTKQ